RSRVGQGGPRAWPGPPPDPATDLLAFFKPHHRPQPAAATRHAGAGVVIGTSSGTGRDAIPGPTSDDARAAEPIPRWDEAIQGAGPALRAAWRVNVLDLDFRAVTAITLTAMLGLCLFVAAVMPPRACRTRETDAL